MHAATEGGHLHVIRYLIDHHGCNPSGQDYYGITPLHLACKMGHVTSLLQIVLIVTNHYYFASTGMGAYSVEGTQRL